MNWYILAFKKYATFSGRARRKEFWYFTLFHNLVYALLFFCLLGELDGLLDSGQSGQLGQSGQSGQSGLVVIVLLVYMVVSWLPSFAIVLRRLHDTNHSGWWLLITFIPFGVIVLFIFFVLDSTPGENRYGPNPKETLVRPISFESD